MVMMPPPGKGDRIHISQVVVIAEAMVGGVRFIVNTEFGIFPVELSGVDNDSSQTGAVSAYPFGQ